MFHQHLGFQYTHLNYPLNLMYPEEYMIFLNHLLILQHLNTHDVTLMDILVR